MRNKWYYPIVLGMCTFGVGCMMNGLSTGVSMGLGTFTGGITIYFAVKIKNKSSKRSNGLNKK